MAVLSGGNIMPEPIDPTIVKALDDSGIAYELLSCDPALADTSDYCAHYGIPLECSANTILVKAKTGGLRFVACVLLANTRLDVNKTVRKRLGARRVSFASAEETRALTGMKLGGVTALALPADLELWVDHAVLDAPYVVLGAGTRAAKIKMSPKVFDALPNVSVVEGLAKVVVQT